MSIAFGFIGAVLNIAVQGGYILVCMALGVGSEDIGQFMTAQLSNDPEAMAGLSAGFWLAYCGIILIGSLLQTAFMLGFCQAALTDSDALDSVKTGIAATLKNVVSLLLFMLVMLLVLLAAVLVIGLLAGLLIAALSMLNSNIALALGVEKLKDSGFSGLLRADPPSDGTAAELSLTAPAAFSL